MYQVIYSWATHKIYKRYPHKVHEQGSEGYIQHTASHGATLETNVNVSHLLSGMWWNSFFGLSSEYVGDPKNGRCQCHGRKSSDPNAPIQIARISSLYEWNTSTYTNELRSIMCAQDKKAWLLFLHEFLNWRLDASPKKITLLSRFKRQYKNRSSGTVHCCRRYCNSAKSPSSLAVSSVLISTKISTPRHLWRKAEQLM